MALIQHVHGPPVTLPSTDSEVFRGTSRFEVVREIGVGGMGVVYEVIDRESGTNIALKTLREDHVDAILRLKNEFRALRDIVHPNLIRYHDLIQQDSQWFFTMELIDGCDFLGYVSPGASLSFPTPVSAALTAQLKPGSGSLPAPDSEPEHDLNWTFDEARLRSALLQIIRALAVLQSHGLVHRDIKPSNVLVTRDGRVVLLDFGLARAMHGADEFRVEGTLEYMAPEQLNGKSEVGTGADLYALGVMLYQALTGRLPFGGAELMLGKDRHLTLQPRSFFDSIPDDLNDLCMELLVPDPETRPLLSDLLQRLIPENAVAADLSRSADAPFVGRKAELEQLEAALKAVGQQQTAAVFVHGESGMGKSALIEHFLTGIVDARPDSLLLTGSCYARESIPFRAFDGIIDALSEALIQLSEQQLKQLLPEGADALPTLFPVLGRVIPKASGLADDGEQGIDHQYRRDRIFETLRQLLDRLAQQRSVVITIDDLQWADRDSVHLLTRLFQPGPPLLFIGVLALTRADSWLQELHAAILDQGGLVKHLTLEPLPALDSRRLLEEMISQRGSVNFSLVESLAESAGGHPLFLQELARQSASARHGGSRPTTAEEALRLRYRALSAREQRILELLVVAGQPMSQKSLAEAAGLEFGTFHRHTERLQLANFVRTLGVRRQDRIELLHDTARKAVHDVLSSETIASHHRRLASIEAANNGSPETEANHWLGAGDHERASEMFARAGRESFRNLAYERAARLLAKANQLAPSTVPAEQQLLLADALKNCGRGTEAADIYLQVAQHRPAAVALQLKRLAADQYLRAGYIDEGLATVREVLKTTGLTIPVSQRGTLVHFLLSRLQIRFRGDRFQLRKPVEISPTAISLVDTCWTMIMGLGRVDFLRSALFHSRGYLLALKSGEPARVARALAVEGAMAEAAGNSKRATRCIERAQTINDTSAPDPYTSGCLLLVRGMVAVMSDQQSAGLELCEAAASILSQQCSGVVGELNMARLFANWARGRLGKLRELATRVPVESHQARAHGDRPGLIDLQTGYCNLAWLALDRPRRARIECDTALHVFEPARRERVHSLRFYQLMAQVNVDLYLGQGLQAYLRVRDRWPSLKKSGLFNAISIWGETCFLRARSALAAVSSGAPTRALAEATRYAGYLRKNKRRWCHGMAELVYAGCHAMSGDKGSAVRHLEAGMLIMEQQEMTLLLAAARRRHYELSGDKAMLKRSNDWCEAEQVKNPERLLQAFAPGFAGWLASELDIGEITSEQRLYRKPQLLQPVGHLTAAMLEQSFSVLTSSVDRPVLAIVDAREITGYDSAVQSLLTRWHQQHADDILLAVVSEQADYRALIATVSTISGGSLRAFASMAAARNWLSEMHEGFERSANE